MFLRGAIKKQTSSFQKLAQTSSQVTGQTRAFSVNDLIQYQVSKKQQVKSAVDDAAVEFNYQSFETLQKQSQTLLAKQQAQEAAEAEWLNSLRHPDQKKAIFGKISEIKDEDHHHLKYIKNKISKLVKQELDFLQFQERLTAEERKNLESDIYKEVKTKSNFYFSIDENKKEKNLKIYNKKAPGNAHRHASVILPHENVHIQRYMNTKDLTEDKLYEIYAYYSHLIDLHISQIRPQNLNEVSYIPPHFNQIESTRNQDVSINNMFFEFYHRWREPTRTWFSKTQELDHLETLKNRPKTHHYDHDKGSKYDVEWTEDQKFPHVADRLGYPILREEPIEKILGIERAPAHPGYQFQPFVQTPSMDPDPTLSFEPGEVIYENKRVVEWIRFWKVLTASTLGILPAFYTFEIYAADGTPSLSWMSDNWNWWRIPQQFQDGSGWNLAGARYCDDHEYMNIQYGVKRSIARPAHTFYLVSVLAMLQNLNLDYVSKMVYNKDKDLVFVYRPDGFWGETEHIYELHHLEQVMPSSVTAIKHLSMQRDDGILNVYCMNTKDYLKFYGEDKYWNVEQKEDFMSQTRSLWLDNTGKYTGKIFQVEADLRPEDALSQAKVDQELQDAIKKHGTVTPPETYENQFFDRIRNKKHEIASQM